MNVFNWSTLAPLLVRNSLMVPPVALMAPGEDHPWVGFGEDETACVIAGPEQAQGLESDGIAARFEDSSLKDCGIEVGGEWLRHLWDRMAGSKALSTRGFEAARAGRDVGLDPALPTAVDPADRHFVHKFSGIDSFVVSDIAGGPIAGEAGVIAEPFARVEDPCSIGRKGQSSRVNIRCGTTIDPSDRVGDADEASIVHGRSHKSSEGLLGHDHVGEWVKLGASTNIGDLRNDSNEVFIPFHGNPIPRGQAKAGCFVGDLTLPGMGSMLNTVTSIGAMWNDLPAGPLLPKHGSPSLPSTWGVSPPDSGGIDSPSRQRPPRVDATKCARPPKSGTSKEKDRFERTRPECDRASDHVQERRNERRPVVAVGPRRDVGRPSGRANAAGEPVSYTHLTLPTKRIV